MGPIDALWHVLNFFAPALSTGILSVLLAKWLWRRELQAVSWWRLGAWASTGSCLALVAGLAVFGRDGKMATYATVVVACASTVWWVGSRAR
jgi:hypothetical protein